MWDREGAIAGGGRPTEPFAAFCGQLPVGWIILDAGDAQAKGALERSDRFMRSNFEPGRRFANPVDFQLRPHGIAMPAQLVERRGTTQAGPKAPFFRSDWSVSASQPSGLVDGPIQPVAISSLLLRSDLLGSPIRTIGSHGNRHSNRVRADRNGYLATS